MFSGLKRRCCLLTIRLRYLASWQRKWGKCARYNRWLTWWANRVRVQRTSFLSCVSTRRRIIGAGGRLCVQRGEMRPAGQLFCCTQPHRVGHYLYLFIYLFVCLSACLPVCQSACPSIHPAIRRSIRLLIYLFICSENNVIQRQRYQYMSWTKRTINWQLTVAHKHNSQVA